MAWTKNARTILSSARTRDGQKTHIHTRTRARTHVSGESSARGISDQSRRRERGTLRGYPRTKKQDRNETRQDQTKSTQDKKAGDGQHAQKRLGSPLLNFILQYTHTNSTSSRGKAANGQVRRLPVLCSTCILHTHPLPTNSTYVPTPIPYPVLVTYFGHAILHAYPVRSRPSSGSTLSFVNSPRRVLRPPLFCFLSRPCSTGADLHPYHIPPPRPLLERVSISHLPPSSPRATLFGRPQRVFFFCWAALGGSVYHTLKSGASGEFIASFDAKRRFRPVRVIRRDFPGAQQPRRPDSPDTHPVGLSDRLPPHRKWIDRQETKGERGREKDRKNTQQNNRSREGRTLGRRASATTPDVLVCRGKSAWIHDHNVSTRSERRSHLARAPAPPPPSLPVPPRGEIIFTARTTPTPLQFLTVRPDKGNDKERILPSSSSSTTPVATPSYPLGRRLPTSSTRSLRRGTPKRPLLTKNSAAPSHGSFWF